MPQMREVKTCDRCRHFKRRCDLVKPSCSRCIQAGVPCSFEAVNGSTSGSAPPASATASSHNASYSHTGFTPTNAISAHHASPINAPFSFPQNSYMSSQNASPQMASVAASPSAHDLTGSPDQNGLISPTSSSSVDSPEPTPMSPDQGSQTSHAPVAASSSGSSQRVVRKRKRNCLSCLRCHRLKVKCDKELPCGRCKNSGNGRECFYSYNKGSNSGKFPSPTAPAATSHDENKAVMATWQVQHKVRGSSHWRDLMVKIGTLSTSDTGPLADALEGVATNACLANFTLPGNFPFGTPGATKYYARDTMTRLVASERGNIDGYIGRYVSLFDCVNPIIDLPQFTREVDRYWHDPYSVSLCWMAQFLMVIGLGCFASAEDPPAATEFMMAAEACLMQTPFMFRPTLDTLRSMTLMVVAKQVCNATCWSVDSCWSLLGLTVRTALSFGLPQERGEDGDEDGDVRDPLERDSCRNLWLTILYLDVKVSMCTGMPPLTRPDELGGLKRMAEWGSPNSLHMVLYQSLPTVLSVLAQLNSKRDPISYTDVLRYNTQLRELMGHAQRVCTDSLQRITVDIFLRRCLMVMHRPFALHPDGPMMFPESYWASLECSLAMLVHFRELWCGERSLRLDLIGRAFVLDFFSATLTACVHVLREDAPLTRTERIACQIPPRQIILDTLRSCIDIWGIEQERSVCWTTGYNLLRVVLGMLPGQ